MSPESERLITDLIGAYLGPAGSGERHDATHALRAHIEALESERDALRAECDRLRAALDKTRAETIEECLTAAYSAYPARLNILMAIRALGEAVR